MASNKLFFMTLQGETDANPAECGKDCPFLLKPLQGYEFSCRLFGKLNSTFYHMTGYRMDRHRNCLKMALEDKTDE